MAGQASAADGVEALALRLGDNAGTTRFVVDLTDKIEFQTFLLADPNRVVIDLPEISWRVPPAAAEGRGVVAGYRFGQFRAGSSRIVLDLGRPAVVQRAFVLAPQGEARNWRFVVDLQPVEREAFMTAMRDAKPQTVTPPPREQPARPPESPQADGKLVVVIDAGHGGVDPGTIGVARNYEKNVTLAMARALRQRLMATGRVQVHLTRDRDIFVPLGDRVRFARGQHADLFVSLHADALADRSARGATVYTLSETASDQEAEALAQKENKADAIAGIDLSVEDKEVATILIDLAQRETMNQSVRLAAKLVDSLGNAVNLQRRPHRFAGFRVLKAPDVPSVLVELGYLSNVQDEAMLVSEAGRTQLADALARAIMGYLDSNVDVRRASGEGSDPPKTR